VGLAGRTISRLSPGWSVTVDPASACVNLLVNACVVPQAMTRMLTIRNAREGLMCRDMTGSPLSIIKTPLELYESSFIFGKSPTS
jgi:hypothetical protein